MKLQQTACSFVFGKKNYVFFYCKRRKEVFLRVKKSLWDYRNPPPSVSWDTSSAPVMIARIRDHWFIANVPVATLN